MRRECRERFPHHPFSDPNMHHGMCVTHVLWCMLGLLTSGFLWSMWRGKRSLISRRMRNGHFYVPGKRPMSLCSNVIPISTFSTLLMRTRVTPNSTISNQMWWMKYMDVKHQKYMPGVVNVAMGSYRRDPRYDWFVNFKSIAGLPKPNYTVFHLTRPIS